MQRNRLAGWMILPLALAAVVLTSACGTAAPTTASATTKPVKVEKVDGSPISRIILTDQAAKRLDLRTEEIRDIQQGDAKRAMPYAAIVYDLKGGAWAYTATEPLTFVRQAVSVDKIQGNVAYLKDGPPAGTQVVTVGVAELYGAEFGVGK
jgi:hypothetical protein